MPVVGVPGWVQHLGSGLRVWRWEEEEGGPDRGHRSGRRRSRRRASSVMPENDESMSPRVVSPPLSEARTDRSGREVWLEQPPPSVRASTAPR